MKHFNFLLLLFLLLIGLTVVGPVSAATWKIDDNYIGDYNDYGGTNYSQNGGDVISGPSQSDINSFDIDFMTVDIDEDGEITITITTDYTSGTLRTDYGDLFISTGGSSWDYVFDTSTEKFYSTSDGSSLYSDNPYNSNAYNTYRPNELVQIDPDSDATDLAEGDGSFERTQVDGTWVLVYSGFNLSDLGLDLEDSYDLAFRWTMTCANDIIEGSISSQPVPEPETMVMLGLGLLGLGAASRRRLSSVRLRSQKQSR